MTDGGFFRLGGRVTTDVADSFRQFLRSMAEIATAIPAEGRKAAAMIKDQINAASMLDGIGSRDAASRRPARFRCDSRRRNGCERHGPRTSISAAAGLHHNSEGRRHSEDRY
jgi:hypothetical protein